MNYSPDIKQAENFSLVLGGPIYQLFIRARINTDTLGLVKRRVIVISLLTWLPLLLLSVWTGDAAGGASKVPFFYDVDVHARFLLALPLVLLPFLPLLLGLGWFLSAIGVFVRDVGPLMTMVVSLAMFMSPVFYSVASLSADLQFWMNLNPLTVIIEQVRAVLLLGQWPAWSVLGLYGVLACVFAAAGATFFQLTRKGFSDVL